MDGQGREISAQHVAELVARPCVERVPQLLQLLGLIEPTTLTVREEVREELMRSLPGVLRIP